MTVSFRSIRDVMKIHNPMKDFALDEIPFEIRFDPLTGRTSRVLGLPYSPPPPPDIEEAAARSRETFCPFCPEAVEKSTPHFPAELLPEGRLRTGEAVVIPNLLPLDKYAAVCVISEAHYIPIKDLHGDVLTNAMTAAAGFAARVVEFDPLVRACSINWNFMPPAGSSIMHPHIQINCGPVATNELRSQLRESLDYAACRSGDFWDDYVAQERASGQRYLGRTGPVSWCVAYAPRGFLPDVWCIFDKNHSIESVSDTEINGFTNGLSNILSYFADEGLYSFNMALFSFRHAPHFRLNARICPRLLTRAAGNSDHTYMQVLHREPYCIVTPESVSDRIRKVFQGGSQ
jgi:UDPglucose--hexose-1-phosphate uridylyltransferase